MNGNVEDPPPAAREDGARHVLMTEIGIVTIMTPSMRERQPTRQVEAQLRNLPPRLGSVGTARAIVPAPMARRPLMARQ